MKKVISFILLAVVMLSCSKEKSDDKKSDGQVQFFVAIPSKSSSLKSSSADKVPASILISVESSAGNKTYDTKKIALYVFNGSYLSEPVSLKPGSYKLTQFAVLDAEDKVIYVTPISGSAKAYLVTAPLPISFTVQKDIVTKLIPEVLDVENNKPEDFGYSTFSFNIVNTIDFLVSVFKYNTNAANVERTEATLKVYVGEVLKYTFPLEGRTNSITVNDGFDSYTLAVSKAGYKSVSNSYTGDQLKTSASDPIKIVLVADDGLVAYYPFNANANDESGNGHNGTVNGAALCADRLGTAKSAYQFYGSSNCIKVAPEDFYLREYTYSLWVKPTQIPVYNSGTVLIDIGNGGGDQVLGLNNNLSGASNGFTFGSYTSSTVIIATEWNLPTSNNWYYLTVTRTQDSLKLYIDGILKASSFTNGMLPYYVKNTSSTFNMGSRYNGLQSFIGVIDEVRVYNRALTSEEVESLYAQ